MGTTPRTEPPSSRPPAGSSSRARPSAHSGTRSSCGSISTAAFDTTFREIGVSFLGGEGSDEARALTVQPDGKIVVAGDGNPSTDVTVRRLASNGQPDPSFGGNGPVEVDFGEFDYGYASALQANGKIVVAGYTTVGGNLLGDFVIVRLQPGGSLDTTFSGDGKQTVNFGGDDASYAMALQPDGKIVAAGEAAGDMAVARLQGEPGPGGGPAGGGPAGGVPGGPRRPSSRVPRCAGRAATIVGTARRDVLRGTRRADIVAALGGDDRIRASAGNDLVCTGAGDDSASAARAPIACSASAAATSSAAGSARTASEAGAAAIGVAAAPAPTWSPASAGAAEHGLRHGDRVQPRAWVGHLCPGPRRA